MMVYSDEHCIFTGSISPTEVHVERRYIPRRQSWDPFTKAGRERNRQKSVHINFRLCIVNIKAGNPKMGPNRRLWTSKTVQ